MGVWINQKIHSAEAVLNEFADEFKYFFSYNFLKIKLFCDFLLFFPWFLLLV